MIGGVRRDRVLLQAGDVNRRRSSLAGLRCVVAMQRRREVGAVDGEFFRTARY